MGCAALLAPSMVSAYTLGEGVKTEDYNKTGVGINKTMKHLSTSLAEANAEGVASAFDESFGTFEPGLRASPEPDELGLRVGEWEVGGAELKGREAAVGHLLAWRGEFEAVDRWIMKLSSIDEVGGDGSARAVIRLEVVGQKAEGQRVTQRSHYSGRFVLSGEGQRLLVGLSLIEGQTTSGPGDLFEERAEEAGLDFFGFPDPRFLPPSDKLQFQTSRHSIGGVSVADVNGDGHDDVLFVGGEKARLFVNKGDGTFENRTEAAGLAGIAQSNVALFSDFDNDGDQDLYLGHFFGRNRLLSNEGTGRFEDVTEASKLAQDDQVASLAAVDVNNDGLLDLYVGRFLDTSKTVPQMIHYSRNGEPNRLYLNRGGLVFEDVSEGSGADDRGLALGIATGDYDRDGDQDIYVANDFGRNVLLRNKGDGTFEDVARDSGAQAISGGMSAAFGDYDGDGLMDIYVSSIRSNQRWFSQDLNVRGYMMNLVQSDRRGQLQSTFLDLREQLGEEWDKVGQHELAGNYLLRNKGDGSFEDVSERSGARQHGWYWGSGFVDIDNDGRLDIYAVNGWISGQKKHDLCLDFARDAVESENKRVESRIYTDKFVGENSWNGRERNHMLLNLGGGKFAEIGSAAGLDGVLDARGMATADFDHDGDADFVLNNYNAQASYLVNRMAPKRGWLAVRVEGTEANRDGVGAEVIAEIGQRRLVRLVSAGHSYASQFSLEQVVGVGEAKGVDALKVRWPDGSVEDFGPHALGQRVRLIQGRGVGKATASLASTAGPTGGGLTPGWILAALALILGGAALVYLSRRQRVS